MNESENVNASEVQLAAHVDPIPLVPVALGVYYINHDYDTKKDGDVFQLKELKGSQIGAELYAWIPLKPTNFSIFGKLGYSFYGRYAGSSNALPQTNADGKIIEVDYDLDLKMTGTKVGLGLKWSPIALVSALLEVDYAQEKWDVEEIKIAGAEVNSDDVDSIDAKSWTILLGAQVGL